MQESVIMKKMEYILIGMLIWIISSAATVSAENNYEWDNVPYGGGGVQSSAGV